MAVFAARCIRSMQVHNIAIAVTAGWLVGWSVGNGRALWPNGWADRFHFWHIGWGGTPKHCIRWAPQLLQNREARAPKFWVQWEGLGKFQTVVMKFCTATTHGPRNNPVKFQPNRPKNRELGPQSLWFNRMYRKTSSDYGEILYIDYPGP